MVSLAEKAEKTVEKAKWNEKVERFAKDRERIKEILRRHGRPLDLAQIYNWFKESHHYLPNIPRRMRELVQSGEVQKNNGKIATYKLM